MKQILIHVLLILVIACGIFFTNLGRAKLWDRDEPRNAGCAVEMLSRGNYVVPTFNGELRHQKPVLLYWLMISAYKVFGINEFSARFWSALLALGTVLATYGIGRRLFHPTAALLSAIILSTTLMFDVAARAATPDSVLIFCSTLSLLIYVLGTFAPQTMVGAGSNSNEGGEGNGNNGGNSNARANNPGNSQARARLSNGINLKNDGQWFPGSFGVNFAMYAAMAFGVLAKGPVGMILPCAIIGMFLLLNGLTQPNNVFWQNQGWLSRILLGILRPFNPMHFLRTCWSMRPLIAMLTLLIFAAPWYALVGFQTDGEFLSKFFVGEHFGRATTALEGHSGPWWFYPVAILVGFFPWSVFWFPTLLGIDRNLTSGSRAAPATLFLLCWAGVQVGLFTLASTKLPSYVTPCYPALAMLVGTLLYNWVNGMSAVAKVWFLVAYGGLILAGVMMTAGLWFATSKILGGDQWLIALGAIPIVGGMVALALAWNDRQRDSVFAMVGCSVLVCVGLFGFGAMTLSKYQQHDVVLGHVFGTDADVRVAAFRTMESSWVVYSQKPVYELALETQPLLEELNVNVGSANTSYTNQATQSEDANGGVGGYLDRFAERYRPRIEPVSSGANTGLAGSTNVLPDKWWTSGRRLTPEEFSTQYPRAAYITTDEHLPELMSRLPSDYEVVEQTTYFLQSKHLVLLARRNSEVAQSAYESRMNTTYSTGFPEDASYPEFTAETGQPAADQNQPPARYR